MAENGDRKENPEISADTRQLINLVQQQMQFMQNTQEKMLQMSEENSLLRTKLAATSNDGGEQSSKTKTPDRPVINDDISEGDWAVFLDTWNRYKSMCKLQNIVNIRNELRSACSPAINKTLIELIGPTNLSTLNKEDLLIKAREGEGVKAKKVTFCSY